MAASVATAQIAVVSGSSVLDPAIVEAAGGVHVISNNGAATATVGGSFTSTVSTILGGNNIYLASSYLFVDGTVTNTGLFGITRGSRDRFFSGSMINRGTVSVDDDGAYFNKANAVYVNEGGFTVTENSALRISGGGLQFTQQDGTLTNQGLFSFSGGQFNYAGGLISGNALRLENTQLTIAPAATGPASFLLTGTNTLIGDVHAGQSVFVTSPSSATTLTSAASFTNAGTITLSGNNIYQASSYLTVDGTLTNTGSIVVQRGSFNRYFSGNLVNHGGVTIDDDGAYFTKANAQYLNQGDLAITENSALRISGGGLQFTQQDGTLANQGLFSFSGGQFNYAGGLISGNALRLENTQLTIAPSATGPASFVFTGTNTLSGDIHAGQSIVIDSPNSATTLTSAASFANAGTITLSGNNIYQASSYLTVDGTLTNTGSIVVQRGSFNRYFNGNLVNDGAVTIDDDGAYFTKASAQYLNQGDLAITGNSALRISGGGQQFTQQDGALTNQGLFSFSGGQFSYAGGSISGNALRLENTHLTIAPTATGPASFVFTGTNTLTGDVHAGQSLVIDSPSGDTTLTSAAGFTNAGTITLSGNNIYLAGSRLIVPNGVLTNIGTIRITPGSNFREIRAELDNQGVLDLGDDNIHLSKAGAQHLNSGLISLQPGSLTRVSNGGHLLNDLNGTLQGTGVLNLSGGSTFTNAGTIAPGFSAGLLQIDGSMLSLDTAVLEIELGGRLGGVEYDQLVVNGTLRLDGELRIALINGFMPSPDDVFSIISGHTLIGAFTNAPERVYGAGWQFDVVYTNRNVVLTNFALVPEPSSLALAAFGLVGALLMWWRRK